MPVKITTHKIQIDLQYNSEYAGSCGQFSSHIDIFKTI